MPIRVMLDFVSKDVQQYMEENNLIFTDFQLATLIYNNSWISEDEKRKKLEILASKTKDEELRKQILKRFFLDENIFNYIEYKTMLLQEKVGVKWLDPKRFEYAFAPTPNPFERGDIVWNISDGLNGVIETSQKEWLELVENSEKEGYVFENAAVDVMFIKGNGRGVFTGHVNPAFLEKYEPQEEEADFGLLYAASSLVKRKGRLGTFLHNYELYNKDLKRKKLERGLETVEIQAGEVYVLGLWESPDKMSICGVYTSKLKLIEGYQRFEENDHRKWNIYRFNLNEYIGESGEVPERNDGGLFDHRHEISILEVQEKVEIYNDGNFQVFCNFNFEGDPRVEIRYIGGSEDEITSVEAFLETDIIKGELSDNYKKYILPVLKGWYNDNKDILRSIWKERRYIEIPNWMEDNLAKP